MAQSLLNDYEAFQRQALARSDRTVSTYLAEVADLLRVAKCAGRAAAEAAEHLKQFDLQSLLAFLQRPTMSQRAPGSVTWNLRLAAVRSLYAYLCKLDLLHANPAMKIERQRSFERPTVALTLQELIALTESARTNSAPNHADRNVALFQVLIHTALRVHEVVALNVDQVDLEKFLLLNVRRKGGKSLAANINDVVAEALRACLAERSRLNLPGDERALFVSDRGQRLSVRSVQQLVQQHGEWAGIKQRVHPHLLRHSSATTFVSLGTPLAVVQDICGHASIETTMRYVHPADESRRRAAETFGQAWKVQAMQTGVATR